jgi:RNA polymerase sigma-70 factor (ECF subfamily)
MEGFRDQSPTDRVLEERALIERARDGHRASQEALVKQYEGRAYGLILRLVRNTDDAKDILQETMVKALTSLDRYDPAYSFTTWLFRIATNKSLDLLRKRKIEFRTFTYDETDPIEDIPNGSTSADEALARKLDWELIERCMEELDPRYRAVLLMRYRDGLEYKEIAHVLSTPMGTVKAMLHRGRNELKRLVRKEVGE